MCNGHADTCDVLDPHSPTRILACQCRHNTAGIHCNECKPGFEQKKWRQNTKLRPFQCERKCNKIQFHFFAILMPPILLIFCCVELQHAIAMAIRTLANTMKRSTNNISR